MVGDLSAGDRGLNRPSLERKESMFSATIDCAKGSYGNRNENFVLLN